MIWKCHGLCVCSKANEVTTCNKSAACVIFGYKEHKRWGWNRQRSCQTFGQVFFSRWILIIIVCIKHKFIFRYANIAPGITENNVARFHLLSLPGTCIIWVILSDLNSTFPKPCSKTNKQNHPLFVASLHSKIWVRVDSPLQLLQHYCLFNSLQEVSHLFYTADHSGR